MINELVSCTYTHTHTQCFAIVFLQATLGFVYAETFAAFSLSFVFASSSLKLLARANAQLFYYDYFPFSCVGVGG
jgi:hypothetical protein